VKHLTPLAVTQYDVTNEKIAQHGGRNFAGIGAAMLPMHVLRANFDVLRLVQRFDHFGDRSKGRHDHHLNRRHVANFEQQIFDELGGLSLQHVHLPVSSDDFFFHKFLRSSRARSRDPAAQA
jgi:hypothetical protein